MIILGLLLFALIIILSIVSYSIGKSDGLEQAYMERAIEVIPYGNKNIVLVSEEYFTIEQAAQIKDAIKKDKPIMYKPKKHV